MKNCICFEADLRKVSAVLRWGTVISGGFLIFTGIFGLVTLFTTAAQALRNPLGFIVMLYISFFGLMIIFGEIGWPRVCFRTFGFLIGRWGRGLFEMFTGSLAITAGVSDSDTVSKVLLLVAGAVIVSFSFLNVFFGKRHEFDTDLDPTRTSEASSSSKPRSGWRWGSGSASTPSADGPAHDVEEGSASAPPVRSMETSNNASSFNAAGLEAGYSGQNYEARGGWLAEATSGVPRKTTTGRGGSSRLGGGGGGSGDPNRAI
ncbi:hypothetical protein F1559_000406 [Cyanidiococcus yangmingshanensis]|uniref:Uncharacterized protein n=1 Tax=Cyanidiococcus yangmingshanensis TaxID=2690220 RepID=A0A7J7IPQ5_9RHOD|nr:hypothetical protein F1559_000406 [Cyanidiococcus yangmingshanensis]